VSKQSVEFRSYCTKEIETKKRLKSLSESDSNP
jgi:hypothetical protein